MPHTDDNSSPIDRGRYWRVLWFFIRVIAHLVWWDLLLGRVFKKRVRATRPVRFRRIARRFRELAVQMGGVLIKLGQFLSARVDVLPVEITEELVGLQDEVAPVPWAFIEPILRAEWEDWSVHFVTFEETPLAAASLGQVHRARLRLPDPLPNPPPGRERERPSTWEGEGLEERVSRDEGAVEGPEVVVKVQRPNIVAIVQTDLAVLRLVARWVAHYRPIRRRADVPSLMEEFARTLWEELDYVAEADNAERFAQMFATDEGVCIPAVYRAHSTGRVLVLEDVGGIKITDVETMRAAGVAPKEVATRLLDTYFQQIFQEGFFHADPHPGNLFVRPLAADGPLNGDGARPFQLVFVDFGMVGRIKELMGDNLRRVLVALVQRDARALTLAYNDLGFFLPGADLERITEAQAVLLERLWGRNVLQMTRPDPAEVQELGREFRDILFDFPFQVPQDFIYLGRTMGMLSGLSTLLDPEVNPWYQAEKFAQHFIDGREVRRFGRETILQGLRLFVSLPAQLQRVLQAAESGQLRLQTTPDRATLRRLDRLERQVSQLNWSVLAAAVLLSGTLLYVNGEEVLAAVAWGGTAGFLILRLIIKRD